MRGLLLLLLSVSAVNATTFGTDYAKSVTIPAAVVVGGAPAGAVLMC